MFSFWYILFNSHVGGPGCLDKSKKVSGGNYRRGEVHLKLGVLRRNGIRVVLDTT